MRKPVWLLAVVLLLTLALPGGAGAGKPGALAVLELSGLGEDQELKDVISFTATVDPQTRSLFAYVQALPWATANSLAAGSWGVRAGANSLRLDTRYLPDGPLALTFYSRNHDGRLHAIRSISVWVRNRPETPAAAASLFDLAGPRQGEVVSGKVRFKLKESRSTNRAAAFEYRIVRLGERAPGPELVLLDPTWDTRTTEPGVYAVTAWALNAAGERQDRATITVEVPARKGR